MVAVAAVALAALIVQLRRLDLETDASKALAVGDPPSVDSVRSVDSSVDTAVDSAVDSSGRVSSSESMSGSGGARRILFVSLELVDPVFSGNGVYARTILRLVVGEYTAATSCYFLLLLASPARV